MSWSTPRRKLGLPDLRSCRCLPGGRNSAKVGIRVGKGPSQQVGVLHRSHCSTLGLNEMGEYGVWRYEGDLVFSLASAQPCSAPARACSGWVGQTVPNEGLQPPFFLSQRPFPSHTPGRGAEGQRGGLSPLGPAAMPYSPASPGGASSKTQEPSDPSSSLPSLQERWSGFGTGWGGGGWGGRAAERRWAMRLSYG